jgi:exopolysaccharide biosynthesis polyprenyl glycosylphosphotransferase
MSLELIQHLRIRLPRWVQAWTIYFLDAIPAFLAYRFTLLPVLKQLGYNWQEFVGVFVLLQVGWGILFLALGLYNGEPTVSRFREIQRLVMTTFTVLVLGVFVNSLWNLWPVTPETSLRYWLLLTVGLIGSRVVFRSFQKYLLRNGIGRQRTVIMGANPRGLNTARQMVNHQQQGYDIIGFVRAQDDPDYPLDKDFPVLGDEPQLKNVILSNQVSVVVLALEKLEHGRLMNIIALANGSPVTIKIVPDLYEVISGLARTEQIYGLPLIKVNPNLETLYNRVFKRLLDLVIVVPAFILFLPFWGIIALLIKINSPGPILYRQARLGRDQKPFMVYKFRSMYKGAEEQTGPTWAREDDPRITKVGRWLRRFRLDEVPQFLNVLKGEMSLVGPRPERPYFVDQLIQEYPFYYRRHKIRPGITGWAQIKHPYDRDLRDVRQKLKYDFYYIENLSFSLDMKIALSTLWVMLSGRGR